jgi:origin recognition complex subunit 3
VHDLWAAFNELVAKSEDGGDNESMCVLQSVYMHPTNFHRFLFQQALAELSYLGMLKSTKKKADHVVKASWRGL